MLSLSVREETFGVTEYLVARFLFMHKVLREEKKTHAKLIRVTSFFLIFSVYPLKRTSTWKHCPRTMVVDCQWGVSQVQIFATMFEVSCPDHMKRLIEWLLKELCRLFDNS